MNKLVKNTLLAWCCLIAPHYWLTAQHAGNSYYKKRTYSSSQQAVDISNSKGTKLVVTANILKYVEADEFVAVFGLSEEAPSVKACNEKITQRLQGFVQKLKGLGIRQDDYYIDMVTQNQVYGYSFDSDKKVATEKTEGFELKKNIAIRYKDDKLLNKMLQLAAQYGIYDLIKVDYLKYNQAPIYKELWKEALKVIEQKKGVYLEVTGVKLWDKSKILSERFGAYLPGQMYQSYTAFQSASVSSPSYSRRNFTRIDKRKLKTVYYDPPNFSKYDKVLNNNPVKPMLQFHLQVTIEYDVVRKIK
ncbi:SIMPL domain-containing protein [Microscilla marina]|uniref:Uncharacterized protein n=1 Tax=Microscilla marina ATCC 23134 TaxID=313606 RepID=A1ZT90_MICM2|nr:SIMPL domain-containing protein [Microscilla marina]EAY26480.1 hypothetical protein M23134_07075 [Microscilla marina ATCC 23134]